MAQILSGDMDAYAISQLFNENGIFLTDQNKADLAARLTEKGVASGNADTLANAVDAAIRGAELTDVQRSALEVNDVLAQAMADVFLKTWKKGATVNTSTGLNGQNGQNALSDYVNQMSEVQTGRDVFSDYVNQIPEVGVNSLQPTAGSDIPAMSRQALANEAGSTPLQMQEAFPNLTPDQQSALQTYQNAQIRLNELKQQRAQLQAELPIGDKAAMQAHASQLQSLNSQIARMEQSLRTAENSRTLQSLQPEIDIIRQENNFPSTENVIENSFDNDIIKETNADSESKAKMEEIAAQQKQVDESAQAYNRRYKPAEIAKRKGYVGVKTTANGGASFQGTSYIYKIDGKECVATIKATGNRELDYAKANEEVGLLDVPEGYLWHHVDNYNVANNTMTLELISIEAHRASTPHMGACAQYDAVHGRRYNKKAKKGK